MQRAKLSADRDSRHSGTETSGLAAVYSYALAITDLGRGNAGQVSIAVANQYGKRQSGAAVKTLQCG